MAFSLSAARDAALSALLVVAAGFNAAMAINSKDGVRMNSLLHGEIARVHAEISALEADKAHLTDRARRLEMASLDRDLLDERVRDVLGLAHHGEYLVRLDDLDQLAENAAAIIHEGDKIGDLLRIASIDAGGPVQVR